MNFTIHFVFFAAKYFPSTLPGRNVALSLGVLRYR